MTYSLDFREKVLEIRNKQNISIFKVAKLFKISKTTIMNWIKNIHAKKNRNKPTITIDIKKLKEDIRKYPDAYQYERAQRLGVTKSGIYHILKRLRVTYKKKS